MPVAGMHNAHASTDDERGLHTQSQLGAGSTASTALQLTVLRAAIVGDYALNERGQALQEGAIVSGTMLRAPLG